MPRKNNSQKKEKMGGKQNSDVYNRQMKWLKEKKEKIQEHKKIIEENQKEGVTFKPTIDEKSEKMATKKNKFNFVQRMTDDIAERRNKTHKMQEEILAKTETTLKQQLPDKKQEKNKEIENRKKAYGEKIKRHLKEIEEEIEKLKKMQKKLETNLKKLQQNPEKTKTKDKNIEQKTPKNKEKPNSSSIQNKANKITLAKKNKIEVADKNFLQDIKDTIKTLTKEKKKIEKEQKKIEKEKEKIDILYSKQIKGINKKVNIKNTNQNKQIC